MLLLRYQKAFCPSEDFATTCREVVDQLLFSVSSVSSVVKSQLDPSDRGRAPSSRVGIRDGHRRFGRLVHAEPEDIGPAVMTDDIEIQVAFVYLVQVQFSVKDAFFAI